MSWEVAQAAALECLDAYLEALQRADFESAQFWRDNTLERIGNLNVALGNYLESGGADGTKP
jgi:ribosome assembly protein YihI (activator of Der GTPase)